MIFLWLDINKYLKGNPVLAPNPKSLKPEPQVKSVNINQKLSLN